MHMSSMYTHQQNGSASARVATIACSYEFCSAFTLGTAVAAASHSSGSTFTDVLLLALLLPRMLLYAAAAAATTTTTIQMVK